MVTGVNGNIQGQVLSDRPLQREQQSGPRPDSARFQPAENRSNLGADPGSRVDPEQLERRIEARRAAEDARLERFRADELPLSTARALDTFAGVAGSSDSGDEGSLAGIDILV